MLRHNLLSIEDHSLAVREDANGMWWQEIVLSPPINSCLDGGVIIGYESRTHICPGLLIETNLQKSSTY